jgi:hypothetical protein
MDVWDQ